MDLLQEVRLRRLAASKDKRAASAASHGTSDDFAVHDEYSMTSPHLAWELSDIFCYSEAPALAAMKSPWDRWRRNAGFNSWAEATEDQRRMVRVERPFFPVPSTPKGKSINRGTETLRIAIVD